MSGSAEHRAHFLVPPASAAVEEMSEPPRFSIVIAAYQAAETIGRALDSALGQAHPAHEVIVVDDGSTDDLERALEPYEGRIVLVKKENGGVSSARNAGIEVAGGDFMAVLDADDRFHPRRLEALAELAVARPDLDLITTDTQFVVDGRPQGTFRESTPFAIADQRTAIFDSCFLGGWPAARLDRLRAIGGFDEGLPVGEDWDCWLRMILIGSQVGLVDRLYYDYTLGEDSLTSDRAINLWARVWLLEKAVANSALRPADRPALDRAYRRHRSRAVSEETRSVLDGEGSRRRLARLACSGRIEPRERALALLAATLPGAGRKLRGRG